MLNVLPQLPLQIQNLSVGLAQKFVSSLIASKAYVNGQWVEAISGETFEVLNPADEKLITCVPDMSEEEAEIAICAAKDAHCSSRWGGMTVIDRYRMIRSWHRLIKENSKKFAELITIENGKPITESRGEVSYSLAALRTYAKDALFLNKDLSVGDRKAGVFVIHQPIGVGALMTSWDFPMALFARKAGAALACGCTLVCKPPKNTPLTILAMCKLAEKIGIPAGVINVVTTTKQRKMGAVFSRSPDVAVVSFSGSSMVCKDIYERFGNTMKRFHLEMYTGATFIAFASANVELAVNGALAAKFNHTGHMTISATRFFVHERIYFEFIDLLKRKLSKLKIGNGMRSDVKIGPLISKKLLCNTVMMVEDARKLNARVHCGGEQRPDIGPLFYEPTIVSDVDSSMLLYHHENFGPVFVIMSFSSEEEILIRANSASRHPAAIFYSHDYKEVFRVGSKLDVSLIGVNENVIAASDVPFTGGVMNRKQLTLGVSEFLVKKYISVAKLLPQTRRRRRNVRKVKYVKRK